MSVKWMRRPLAGPSAVGSQPAGIDDDQLMAMNPTCGDHQQKRQERWHRAHPVILPSRRRSYSGQHSFCQHSVRLTSIDSPRVRLREPSLRKYVTALRKKCGDRRDGNVRFPMIELFDQDFDLKQLNAYVSSWQANGKVTR